jgi:hypothetical protein
MLLLIEQVQVPLDFAAVFSAPRKNTPLWIKSFVENDRKMGCEFGTHSYELELCLPRVITVKVAVAL